MILGESSKVIDEEVEDIIETKFNYTLHGSLDLPFGELKTRRSDAYNKIFKDNNIPLYIEKNALKTNEINSFSLNMKSRAVMKEILIELFSDYIKIYPIHWGDDYRIESTFKTIEKVSSEEIALCETMMCGKVYEESENDSYHIITFEFDDVCHYYHIKKALKSYYAENQGGWIIGTINDKSVIKVDNESFEEFLLRFRAEAISYYRSDNEQCYDCIRVNDIIIDNLTK